MANIATEAHFFVGLTRIHSTSHSIFQSLNSLFQLAAQGRWVGPLFQEIMILAAWNIWKTRNNVLFEGIPPSTQGWCDLFKCDILLLSLRVKPALASFLHSLISNLFT